MGAVPPLWICGTARTKPQHKEPMGNSLSGPVDNSPPCSTAHLARHRLHPGQGFCTSPTSQFQQPSGPVSAGASRHQHPHPLPERFSVSSMPVHQSVPHIGRGLFWIETLRLIQLVLPTLRSEPPTSAALLREFRSHGVEQLHIRAEI